MMQSVYVFATVDRTKVGRSKQIAVRKATHEREKQCVLETTYVSAVRSDAAAIERVACRILRNNGYQISGEWFAVPPHKAVEAVLEACRIVEGSLSEPAVERRSPREMAALFSMRLDPELKSSLIRLAEKQNRSLTNYVETLLRQHVEAEKKGGRK